MELFGLNHLRSILVLPLSQVIRGFESSCVRRSSTSAAPVSSAQTDRRENTAFFHTQTSSLPSDARHTKRNLWISSN